MTGAELQQLRHGYAYGSAPTLARRLGIHERTVYRNVRRPDVTPYVARAVAKDPLALAHLQGLRRGLAEAAAEEGQVWTDV